MYFVEVRGTRPGVFGVQAALVASRGRNPVRHRMKPTQLVLKYQIYAAKKFTH